MKKGLAKPCVCGHVASSHMTITRKGRKGRWGRCEDFRCTCESYEFTGVQLTANRTTLHEPTLRHPKTGRVPVVIEEKNVLRAIPTKCPECRADVCCMTARGIVSGSDHLCTVCDKRVVFA